ncbi:Asp23/Gls24 family envelope stress response protein [Pseudonocardia phyllosphaerae]|uniref:Asp23/Gls24 family envelope stress response protein n=1 Tax=Pseudonocardia phyllosphaerae TaxID=3390502 RepID=UPI00397A7E50
MTGAVPGVPPQPPPADDTPTREIVLGRDAFVERRGRVDVADRVVEKIAGAALGEVDGVDRSGRTKVDADVVGSSVRLSAQVPLVYPSPVAATCDRARAHTVERVHALTGLEVTRCDIVVSALNDPAARKPGTGRELA